MSEDATPPPPVHEELDMAETRIRLLWRRVNEAEEALGRVTQATSLEQAIAAACEYLDAYVPSPAGES